MVLLALTFLWASRPGKASLLLLPIDVRDMSADGRVFVGTTTVHDGEPVSWTEKYGIQRLADHNMKGVADRVSADGSVILFWGPHDGPEWLYAKREKAKPQQIGKVTYSFDYATAVRPISSGKLLLTVADGGSTAWYRQYVKADKIVLLERPEGLTIPLVSMTPNDSRFFGCVLGPEIDHQLPRQHAAVWDGNGHIKLLASASPTSSSHVDAASYDGALLGGMIDDKTVVWSKDSVAFVIPPIPTTLSGPVTAIRSLASPIYGYALGAGNADIDYIRAWVRLPSGQVMWFSSYLESLGVHVGGERFHAVLRISRDGKTLLVSGSTEKSKNAQWRVTLP